MKYVFNPRNENKNLLHKLKNIIAEEVNKKKQETKQTLKRI